MSRWDTFTFRVNKDDRQLIAKLAESLQRSQSDAIRFVIRQTMHQVQGTAQVNINDPHGLPIKQIQV
jgi:hypothetical protein